MPQSVIPEKEKQGQSILEVVKHYIKIKLGFLKFVTPVSDVYNIDKQLQGPCASLSRQAKYT